MRVKVVSNRHWIWAVIHWRLLRWVVSRRISWLLGRRKSWLLGGGVTRNQTRKNTVSSASFDSTGSLTSHGGLGDCSTHDLGVRSHSDGCSREHVANQDTVSAHGESSPKNPEDIICLGSIQELDFAPCGGRQSTANVKYELGV